MTLALLLALLAPSDGLQDGFRLPQLGWNSWNHYACHVTEQDVRNTAEAFVSTGMKAAGVCSRALSQLSAAPILQYSPALTRSRASAGYEYVNVDDCWMSMNRTAEGKLTHDPVR